MVLWFLCKGAPEDSTGSGSVLKLLRRRGHSLMSHPTDWEKPGIKTNGFDRGRTLCSQDVTLYLQN